MTTTAQRVTRWLTALALAAVGATATPASAMPTTPGKALDVASTVVHGACRHGGQVTLVVTAAGNGFDVAATATGLTDGERWRGSISILNPAGAAGSAFQRTVEGTGWSVRRHLDGVDQPRFRVTARPTRHRLPDAADLCTLTAKPQQPLSGSSTCRGPVTVHLTAARRTGGTTTIVRWGFAGARPHSTWEAELTANSDAGDVTIGFAPVSPRDGSYQTHLRLDAGEPRLRLKLRGDHGQRCSLTVARTLAATP